MVVNKKSTTKLILSLFLPVILMSCSSSSSPPPSESRISGTLSTPVSGAQIFEYSEFGDNDSSARQISYGASVYGSIGALSDEDWFTFNAKAGDDVIIDIDAESEGSALNSVLELYDSGSSLIAQNDNYPPASGHDPANYFFTLDSHIEATIPADGAYYIKVSSSGGASSGAYILRLLSSSPGAALCFAPGSASGSASNGGALAEKGSLFQGTGDPEPEFVPGEIIVQYKPGIHPQSMATQAAKGFRVEKTVPMGAGEVSLLRLGDQEGPSLSVGSLKEKTLSEVEKLNALPSVEYAEPNYIYKPLFTPNDTYYYLQWHYPLIKLDQVWDEDLVPDVSGVTVAVIDTGIARPNGYNDGSNHEDLGNFVDEYDFISDKNFSLDGDGMDGDATDPGDDPLGVNSSFHGTHVTGTIGAITNNDPGSGLFRGGVAGVAGAEAGQTAGVKIMPLRTLGAGGGTVFDIAQAVLYAAGLSNASGAFPTEKADIINMSLGGTGDSDTLRNAIIDAYNAGLLIVAAAGNAGSSAPFYPAAYDQVISVSAVGLGAERAPYSSYGSTVDIAAPGGDLSADLDRNGDWDGVLSTLMKWNKITKTYDPIYAFYQGTSMAAPHVAGVAALIKGANSGLTHTQIRSYLINNAIDLWTPGHDPYYGHGLVNAYASVKAAGGAQAPILFPFPKTLRLQGSNPSGILVLKNIGDSSTIAINSIAAANDPDTIVSNISPASGNAGSGGLEVTVSLDTSGVEDGYTHYAVIEITYTLGSTAKNEYMYVMYNSSGFVSPIPNENIGNVFVFAQDAQNYKTVAMVVAKYAANYEYTIEGLEQGRYVIVARTDRDNDSDRESCDPGEACGSYPFPGSQIVIELDGEENRTGIDFEVTE